MHSLSHIRIKNFKSCHDIDLILSDFTPLVGYNNGGKSNILEAIRWLLRATALSEKDFHDPLQPVEISGQVDGITDQILENLIPQHRDRITPFCQNGILRIRRVQPGPDVPVRNIRLEIRNPDIEDEQAENAWAVNPNGIDAAIKTIFPEPIEISAMQDSIEDVCKSKSTTTIGKLISEIMAPIEQQHGAALHAALEGIRAKFEAEGEERAKELNDFDQRANENLKELFPGIQVRIHVPSPEIKELFKNGTIKIIEDGFDKCRDVQALGHGAQRSIQMALIRYLADIKAHGNQNPTRTLLLIDEPELYLHPQAVEYVRSALKSLAEKEYQVIFATHSPLMISADDIGTTVIVWKNNHNKSYSRKRLSDAIKEVIDDAPSQLQTLFELSNSSQILFSDKVIITEGRTEQRLLPEIYHLINHQTLSTNKTALVSPGGAGNTIKCMKILAAMGIPAKAIVDLDFVFKNAVGGHLLPDNDLDVIACRDIFKALSRDHDFHLSDDGFPQKGGSLHPAAAFALFAKQPESSQHIESLHQKMLAHNIWLWEKGAIEEYLGIEGKNEKAWAHYKIRLRQDGCQATLSDFNGMVEMLDWLQS